MTAHPRPARASRRTRITFVTLSVTAGLLLTACDEYRRHELQRNALAVELSNPERRHPIAFDSRKETLDVEVPPGAEGLSPNQHTDVFRFLQRYKREASGRFLIIVPTGVRDKASIAGALQGIQYHVVEAGVDYRVTHAPRGHDPRVDGAPSIRLAYQKPVAVPPPCDHWGKDVGRNEERIPYPNWGCATQHNLAVMIDNGRDYHQPQEEDPRSSERRSLSWSAYAGGAARPETSDETKKAVETTKK